MFRVYICCESAPNTFLCSCCEKLSVHLVGNRILTELADRSSIRPLCCPLPLSVGVWCECTLSERAA